jgi:holo-[acyl-carrier protein] synthase
MLRTGVDIIEVPRIARALERHGDRFIKRCYTEGEAAYCRRKPQRLATHFAAKEAISKALGTGIGPVSWREMEIRHHPSGRPDVILHGRAAKIAEELGLTEWSVSLSDESSAAIAFVVAMG